MHTEPGSQGHHRQDLQAAGQVAEGPEPRQIDTELHPGVCVNVVLRPEFPVFPRLRAEGPHHPHAGQILLGNGGEEPLVLIALRKLVPHPEHEEGGIPGDQRHKSQHRQGEPRVHRCHEAQCQRDHQHHPDQVVELFRTELLQHVHVTGTALDDIPRRMGHVPGIGQPHNVAVQPVMGCLHQLLPALRVLQCGEPAEHGAQCRRQHHSQGCSPEMSLQPYSSAGRREHCGQCCRQFRLRVPDTGVHRDAQHLRDQHVAEGHKQRCQDPKDKIASAPVQKGQEQAPLTVFFHKSDTPIPAAQAAGKAFTPSFILPGG